MALSDLQQFIHATIQQQQEARIPLTSPSALEGFLDLRI